MSINFVGIKIGCSGFGEGSFSLVLIGKGSTGEKVTEVLEKTEVSWLEVWGLWWWGIMVGDEQVNKMKSK